MTGFKGGSCRAVRTSGWKPMQHQKIRCSWRSEDRRGKGPSLESSSFPSVHLPSFKFFVIKEMFKAFFNVLFFQGNMFFELSQGLHVGSDSSRCPMPWA